MPKMPAEKMAGMVAKITSPGLHMVGGVTGLALRVSATGSRSWILRVTVGDKRRDIGIGSYPSVGLAEARERARAVRASIWSGVDPVAERIERRRALAPAQAALTFDDCVGRYLKNKEAEFRSLKHRAQWRSTLLTYASPHIGTMPVRDVELRHVLEVLLPVWNTKTETASRVRGRMESVLAWSIVSGHRDGPNPATWKGQLDAVLPAPGKLASVEHHRALPFADVPGFIAELRQREGIAARAVEFVILTAARSGEVRGATWNEIDIDAATWTIPASRMKASKEHRVPLSPDAVELLRGLPRIDDNVFSAPRGGSLSDMSLSAVLGRMKVPATVHGFRSSFRDWAGETSTFPRETIEHALAHQLKDKAEASYARGSQFDKRRKLMEAWARFCASPARLSAEVLPLRGSARG